MQGLTIMTINNLVESIDLNGNHDLNFYDGCEYRKHDHAPFLLRGGFCARINLNNIHGNFIKWKNILTFIDDFLKKTFTYTMKSNFIMFDKFKGFQFFGGK
jgi:hypothetical protein